MSLVRLLVRILVGVLAVVALLLVGASAAVAATLVHERWWGLVLGLAAAAFVTGALPPGGWRLSFMLGWLAAIGYAVLPRAEGDYLIAASTAGYVLLGGSFLVFLAALVTLPRPGSRPPRQGGDQQVLEG